MENEIVEEQQVDNSGGETTETNTESGNNAGVDSSKPVTSLTEAKEVLKAQRENREANKPKNENRPVNQNTSLDYKKQYEEMQKLVGKNSQELNELRRFQQENKQVIDFYKNQQNQLQEQQLLQRGQKDPLAVIKELARREAQASLAPYQAQIQYQQVQGTHNYIKESLGSDYETLAPIMHSILKEYQEADAAQGTSYADAIAQKPNELIRMAQGQLYANSKKQNAQRSSAGQQKKENNLRIANQVGKGNTNKSTNAPENFQNLSLEEMTKKLKELGIKK